MCARIPGHALAACLLAALGLATGCGESWQAEVHPATGTVTINGEPPVGALVQLVPAEGTKTDERNSRPWGLVNAEGKYSLATYDGQPGAPAGTYHFTMTWPPDASRPSLVDRLKNRYSKPEKSPMKMTIKPGENTLPPVELTGVEVDAKADASAPVGPMMKLEPAGKSAKGRR